MSDLFRQTGYCDAVKRTFVKFIISGGPMTDTGNHLKDYLYVIFILNGNDKA